MIVLSEWFNAASVTMSNVTEGQKATNWDTDFAGLAPIDLPDGRKLETLCDLVQDNQRPCKRAGRRRNESQAAKCCAQKVRHG